jgi:hypothetical protein
MGDANLRGGELGYYNAIAAGDKVMRLLEKRLEYEAMHGPVRTLVHNRQVVPGNQQVDPQDAKSPHSRDWPSYRYRNALLGVERILRDQNLRASHAGRIGLYRGMISKYRDKLIFARDNYGKDKLDRMASFFGIAINECDELLLLCGHGVGGSS